jgi:hypothetical protein
MPDQFSAVYEPRERHQTPSEGQAVLAELEPDRAARVAFILGTGARLRESDSARHGDINLEESTRCHAAPRRMPRPAAPDRGFAVPSSPDLLRERRRADPPAAHHPRDPAAACKRAGVLWSLKSGVRGRN